VAKSRSFNVIEEVCQSSGIVVLMAFFLRFYMCFTLFFTSVATFAKGILLNCRGSNYRCANTALLE